MEKNKIVVYTDGSARGNPGPGGYGIVMMFGTHRKEFSAGYRMTTNNRMELLAVIRALEMLKTNAHEVHVYTDSKYVADTISKGWLSKWVSTGFKGKKNRDLWMQYYNLSKKFQIKFHWVKGHADNIFNNRCDELATSAAMGSGLLVDKEYEMGIDRPGLM